MIAGRRDGDGACCRESERKLWGIRSSNVLNDERRSSGRITQSEHARVLGLPLADQRDGMPLDQPATTRGRRLVLREYGRQKPELGLYFRGISDRICDFLAK